MTKGLKTRLLSGACVVVALGLASAAGAQVTPSVPPGRTGGPPAANDGDRATGVSRSDAGQRAAPVNQDTNAGSGAAVGEVIVTGVRANTVQHTAAAVTAFTDERRNLLGIETGRDIANLTPSVSLQGEYLTVRGVGRFVDPGAGLDPGVAVHVDGVYTSSPAYLSQPDFLTDRIEVLRGPQSVFGRNSLGGTVNVYSKRPTADYHGDFRAGYTSQEYGYVDAAISGPINDKLRFRAAFFGSDLRDGEQNNEAKGYPNPGTGNLKLFETQLDWTPTPDVDIFFRAQSFDSVVRNSYGVIGPTLIGIPATNQLNPFITGTPATYTTQLYDGLAPNPQFGIDPNSNPALRNKANVSIDDLGHNDDRNDYAYTINASWNLHFATLKYIGGYSQYTADAESDADGTSRSFLTSPAGRQVASYYANDSQQDKKWSSHELILSSPVDLPIRGVLGGYYYTERYRTVFSVQDPLADYIATPVFNPAGDFSVLTPAAPNPTRAIYSQRTTLRSDNEAVYGQVEYDVLPAFRLTGAIRGNFDKRDGTVGVREIFDLYGIYGDFGLPRVALDVTPALNKSVAKKNFNDWSGKINAEFHPDPSLIAYVTVAKGYKSGGFDLVGSIQPVPVVQPETLTDYEGGIKKTFGKKLLVDVSAYDYEYKNLQVPITVATSVINPVTMAPNTLFQNTLANAQRTRSYGFELESVYSPFENLHLTVIYSYQHAKFLNFTSPTPGGLIQDPVGIAYANLKGNTVPQAPKNKVSFIPQYVVHTGRGDLSLSSIFTYTDPTYYAVFNTDRYRAPSYYNLDFRVVFQPTKSHFTAILYARNVTNSDQFIYYAPSTAILAEQSYTLAEQRTVGAELQYRF